MLASAHQGEFHLVLNVFDVHGAAGGHATLECCHDLLGELCHGLVNPATGRCGSPFYCQECFGNCHGNLAVFKGNHSAIAFYYAKLAGGGCLKSCLLSYVGIRV